MSRIVIIFIVCLGLFFWLIAQACQIKNLVVIGQDLELAVDQTKFPPNLVFFPKDKFITQIKKDYPLLKAVIVRKRFPDTLILDFQQRTPVAMLRKDNLMLFFDQEGYLVKIDSQFQALPEINLHDQNASFVLGQKITNPQVLQILKLISMSVELLKFDIIYFANDSSIQAKVGKTTIFFPQDLEAEKELATLQNLFNGFRIKGTLPNIIDLRYKKPSLTY